MNNLEKQQPGELQTEDKLELIEFCTHKKLFTASQSRRTVNHRNIGKKFQMSNFQLKKKFKSLLEGVILFQFIIKLYRAVNRVQPIRHLFEVCDNFIRSKRILSVSNLIETDTDICKSASVDIISIFKLWIQIYCILFYMIHVLIYEQN